MFDSKLIPQLDYVHLVFRNKLDWNCFFAASTCLRVTESVVVS